MQEQLGRALTEARTGLEQVRTQGELEALKARISGPKGLLTLAMRGMKDVPKEDKPAMGRVINETKAEIEALFSGALESMRNTERTRQLGPEIDPTLPAAGDGPGGLHPLTQVRREVSSIFRKLGFVVAEGPEAETEWYCFDALNTPADHPARDAQDTLFIDTDTEFGNVSRHGTDAGDERFVLRTHTSSVQIRTMLERTPPVRVIAPGRCFRRDTVDATHSANFHQVEGLYVDEVVSVKDLKAVLDYFVRAFFGNHVRTRLRPSFFPFTEPSFELDILSPDLGRLSNRWMEVLGCGMVDPNVFEAVGYNTEKWTGFAFGLGLERIAMIRHGIDDIRLFYQNDLRFLRQFA